MLTPRNLVRGAALTFAVAMLGTACGDDATVDAPPPAAAAATDRVWVLGAPLIGGGSGLSFDDQDRLYIATGSQSIAVMDPDSGAILRTMGPEVGVMVPDDVVVASDGTLYWTEILFGRVHGLAPDGTMIVVADGLFGVNPITMSDDGQLFFAQCFNPQGNGIFRGDPTGATPPVAILEGVEGCAANGMDWWQGGLYVPRWFEDRIVRVDVASGEVTVVTADFPVPTAVKLDSKGRLHAISTATGEVIRVDLATGAQTVVATLSPGIDNLAFDSRDRLFVSRPMDASVVEVKVDGSIRSVSAPGMGMPVALAFLDGVVYTGGFGSLRGFSAGSGVEVSAVTSPFGVPGPLPFPVGTLAALNDQLILGELWGGQLATWDPKTEQSTAMVADVVQIADIEPFRDGVVVSDVGTGRLVLFDGPELGTQTTLADGLTAPTGLAAFGGDLYLSDVASGTLMQVARDGIALPTPEVFPIEPLVRPEGITVNTAGELIVVEAGTGMLKAVDLSSFAVRVVATDLSVLPPLPGFVPFHLLNDVAIGMDGELYVNSDGAAVIYRF